LRYRPSPAVGLGMVNILTSQPLKETGMEKTYQKLLYDQMIWWEKMYMRHLFPVQMKNMLDWNKLKLRLHENINSTKH
jgi:hypothetical protein